MRNTTLAGIQNLLAMLLNSSLLPRPQILRLRFIHHALSRALAQDDKKREKTKNLNAPERGIQIPFNEQKYSE
jgi:hypothetical protein